VAADVSCTEAVMVACSSPARSNDCLHPVNGEGPQNESSDDVLLPATPGNDFRDSVSLPQRQNRNGTKRTKIPTYKQ